MTDQPPRIGWDNPNPMSGKRSGWRHPAARNDPWVQCWRCNGQRQVWTRKADGLVPDVCERCLGLGYVYREGAT